MSRFSAGHPLESTTIESWSVRSERSLLLEVGFRDDAPGYGCGVEALSSDGESLGWKRARPRGEEARETVMYLSDGRAAEVDDVRVTDCDI
jgi:hypothetical protein